jgi:hypothetical protein
VPLELEDAVMRCLAKDREERFHTVSELARALAPFGSLSSQVHVDRASRVLGVTDVSFLDGSLNGDRPSNADRSGPVIAQGMAATPLRGSRPTPAPPIRGTVDSWGRTDAPQGNVSQSEPRRSRAPLFVGLGMGVAALLGVVLFLGIRDPSAPPSASASVAAPPPPLSSAVAPVAVVPVPVQAPEPQVLPSAAAPEPGAPLVRPQEPAAAKPKPAVAVQAFRPKPVPAPLSGDVSDFGGRR